MRLMNTGSVDRGSKAELSQDAREGPALASGVSDVSGQAAKDHSLWLKKGQQARLGTHPLSCARAAPERLQD